MGSGKRRWKQALPGNCVKRDVDTRWKVWKPRGPGVESLAEAMWGGWSATFYSVLNTVGLWSPQDTEAEDVTLSHIEESSRLSPGSGSRDYRNIPQMYGRDQEGSLEDSCDQCGLCISLIPMLGMLRQGDYKVRDSLGCIAGA